MTKPDFRIFDTADAVAAAVAKHVASAIRAKPQSTLGLATGKTFVPIYRELVQLHRQGLVSFADAASFNLDEYVGLPASHRASFRAYMQEHFFAHVDLPRGAAQLPQTNGDLQAACLAYEYAIADRGGIDLQLLGIGQNGHIGFNEPGSPFDSRTHVATLTESTIAANTSDFPQGERPPGRAITMGIGTILEAREIVLVAIGPNKAQALLEAFERPQSSQNPASALQSHPRVTVYCDQAARPSS
jgi:glucosamine-6-phosphate deaminase